jgi:hypothetical protein
MNTREATNHPHRSGCADGNPPWAEDLSRMGLHFDADGALVTVTSQVMPALFGRPALHEFSLSMDSTTFVRLRHLILFGDDRALPVCGHVATHDSGRRPTSRLLAHGASALPRLVVLEVTIWVTSADGSEAWVDDYLLDNLTCADLDHFDAVLAMWDAGVRPRHDAPRYVAAGFSPREARELQDSVAPTDRNDRIDLLIALRTDASQAEA